MKLIFFLSLFYTALVWCKFEDNQKDEIVIRVNGEPIYRTELGFLLKSHNNSVRDSVEATIENVIVIKLQQILAANSGIIKDASYQQFRFDWQSENAKRREAKAKNEVVYGPLEFSELAYYHYRQSQIMLQLKREYALRQPAFSDSRISAAYDSMRPSMFRKHDVVQILKICVSSSSKFIDEIKRNISNYESPELLMSKYPCFASIDTIDERNSQILSEDDPEYLEVVNRIRINDVEIYQLRNDSTLILKCKNRIPGGYRSLDEVEEIVKDRLLGNDFGKYLTDIRKRAEIKVDKKVLNKFIKDNIIN
jgi:hypothetical protein